MFKDAYETVRQFTRPLIVALRFYDKTIEGGLGSFIILNDDGWLMTAAHNFGASFAFKQHEKQIKEYQEQIKKINENKQLKQGQRNALLRANKINKKWVTNFTILLGGKPFKIEESHIYGKHDLALFRVDKNIIKGRRAFPKLIDPEKIKPGTSLCKLGFPFVEFKPSFNEEKGQFNLPHDLLPVPLFPIEGIYTRDRRTKNEEGGINVQYLETSSPGLKGQSGGPIFDTDGNVYAIQSNNLTLPLGFKGKIKVKGETIEENQFLNVGIGIHPKTIKHFLDKHEIKYELAE